MVFSLFFGKKSTEVAPESVPLPPSPPPPQDSVTFQAPISPVGKLTSQAQLQLRTPSPSIHGAHAAGSPAPTVSNLSAYERPMSPSLQQDLSKDATALPPAPVHTPASLTTLLSIIPAKIVHSYLLSHIPGAPDHVVQTLGTFFETIAPPPRLHCVRCHKDYVEIENDNRSCLVAHDDESALVERIGITTKKIGRRRAEGMEYETLWGCCGQTSEGNGDQGPPDGWCYEGKHTTDLKRARFRADSTPQDDKLVSCIRLNCHGIRSQLPRPAGRKRPRASVNYKDASGDDDASEGEADSGMEEIVEKAKGKPKTPKSAKGKGKAKQAESQPDKMEVDGEGQDVEQVEDDSVSRTGSVRDKGKGRAKAKEAAADPSPLSKRRPRPSKSQVLVNEEKQEAPSPKPVSTPAKRRGRQFKSKEFIEDSDEELERKRKTGSVSPTRADPPGTRSQSRTRLAGKPESTRTPLRPHMSRAKVVPVPEAEDEADEEKPRKKRKVSA